MPDFSHYAPPCVPMFNGDNGGATSQGVTGDTIKVVCYFPQRLGRRRRPRSQAIGGRRPPPADEGRRSPRSSATTTSTTRPTAAPSSSSPSSRHADPRRRRRPQGRRRADRHRDQAVRGDRLAREVTAAELAARGVICMCTRRTSRAFYKQSAPYMYRILPDAEEYYEHIAEYIGKRLEGKPAKWAGDLPPSAINDERKFGLIYLEGAGRAIDPDAKQAAAYYDGCWPSTASGWPRRWRTRSTPPQPAAVDEHHRPDDATPACTTSPASATRCTRSSSPRRPRSSSTTPSG